MAQKLTLEIEFTGQPKTVGGLREIQRAIDAMDQSLKNIGDSVKSNIADKIANAAKAATTEIDALNAKLNAAKQGSSPAPSSPPPVPPAPSSPPPVPPPSPPSPPSTPPTPTASRTPPAPPPSPPSPPIDSGDKAASGANRLVEGVTNVAFGFNQALQAVQSLMAGGQQAYDLLIGANERLNQQLLQSSATIAATSSVFKEGVEIKDPTLAITALQEPLGDAIKRLQIESKELVGVTSQDVIGVFNVVTGRMGDLQGQSKQFNNAIDSSVPLTKNLVAALGTMKMPLEQANQEIGAILTGQITSDAQLARSLGINNQMVAQWKSQGVLVDEINKRLTPFAAGNKLAAESIDGITSNMMDTLQIVGRMAGEPLLKIVVDQLKEVYEFISKNEAAIQQFAVGAGEEMSAALSVALEFINAVGKEALPALENLLPQIMGGLAIIKDGLVGTIELINESGVVAATVGMTIQGWANIMEATIHLIRGTTDLVGAITGGTARNTEAVTQYSNVTASLVKEGIKRQHDLKDALTARQEAEKNGGQITEQQAAKEKAAVQGVKATIAALQEHRKELKELKVSGDDNRASVAAQISETEGRIKLLEKEKDALSKVAGGVSIKTKALAEQGDIYKQLEDKTKNAKKLLETDGGGKQDAAEQAAKDIQKLSETSVEMGKMSTAEAVANLQAIANNTKLSNDTQEAAIKAITKLKKTEGEEQIADVTSQQKQITVEIGAGHISQMTGERQLTAAKINEINKRLEVTRAALEREKAEGRGNGDEAQKLINQEKDLQSQLATETAKGLKLKRDEELKSFDNKLTILEAQKKQDKISELDFLRASADIKEQRGNAEIAQLQEQKAKLKATDKAGLEAIAAQEAKIRGDMAATRESLKKAELEERTRVFEVESKKVADTEKAAETEKLAAILEMEKNHTISREEAAQQRSEITIKSIQTEIDATQKKAKFLQSQEALNDPKAEDKRQADIRAALQNAASLQLKLIQEQNKQQEALLQERTSILEAELKQAADVEKAAETERMAAIQEMESNHTISRIEANRMRTESSLESTRAEIDAAQKKAEFLQSQEALNDPKAEDKRQADIRAALQNTASLQLKLMQEQEKQQEQLRAKAIKAIDDENDAAKRGVADRAADIKAQSDAYDDVTRSLEKQQRNQDTITKSLDTQARLIESRGKLADAAGNLESTRMGIQVQNLQRASEISKQLNSGEVKDAGVKAALQAELKRLDVVGDRMAILRQQQTIEDAMAAKKIEQQNAEMTRAQALQEIELKRNQLAAERAVLEAKIAENKAKQALLSAQSAADDAAQKERDEVANLEKTKIEKYDDPNAIANAEEQVRRAKEGKTRADKQVGLAQSDVGLQSENLKMAQSQLTGQAELAKNSRDTLAAQQEATKEQQAQTEFVRKNTALMAIANTQAEISAEHAKRLADNLAKAADTGKAPVPAQRFRGGPMAKNQPYWVGESSDGAILPTSEIIVPETDSYAIAAIQAQEWLRVAANNTVAAIRGDVMSSNYYAAPMPYPVPTVVIPENDQSQLINEIVALRREVALMRQESPVPISQHNEFHNTFARNDERDYLDKIRRQTNDVVGRTFDAAFNRLKRDRGF